MKLLELLPTLESFTRIKRAKWRKFLVRSIQDYHPLVELDLTSIQISLYTLTYEDLMADDWEIMT